MKRQNFDDLYIPEPNSGCWLWIGSWDSDGYGRAREPIGYGEIKAHRLSYKRSKGPIPPNKLVCHTCDVPCCVNPDHLFIGTHKINHEDRNRKGRQAKHEKQGSAKLTDALVEEIRNAQGYLREIAKRFNISIASVHRIKAGKQWQ